VNHSLLNNVMYVVLQAKDVQILPVSDLWMFIDIWGRVLGRRVGPSQKTLVHKGGGSGYTSMPWMKF